MRADRWPPTATGAGLTPFLDELAARGTLFANAYAPTSWTCPSIASLFTSRYPSQHGVTTFESKLPDDELTFAEVFAAHDYAAKAFTANFRINTGLGYAQGFTQLRSYLPRGENAPPKARAEELRHDSLAWLEGLGAQPGTARRCSISSTWSRTSPTAGGAYLSRLRRGAGDPAAANAKLIELRYNELSDDEVTMLESLYDAEVASLDADLRELFTGLERLGRLRNAIVVVTSDHGEEFREHGLMTHGLTLFEESIRVPLIVLGSGAPAGRVVPDPVTLLDVAPTLLAFAGLPLPPRFEGRSLRERLAGGDAPDIFLELLPPSTTGDLRRHAAGLVRDGLKVLEPPWPDQADRRAEGVPISGRIRTRCDQTPPPSSRRRRRSWRAWGSGARYWPAARERSRTPYRSTPPPGRGCRALGYAE